MIWPMRLNWNGALLFAVAWLVVGIGGGSIWAYAGVKKQALSYQVALAALHAMPEAVSVESAPIQRKAVLLKTGSTYDWRALVWLKTPRGREAFVWQAVVSRQNDAFHCTSTRLHPYSESLASSLSVYDEP